MSNLLLPSRSDAEKALTKLKAAEDSFLAALGEHDAQMRNGGEALPRAAGRLAAASRAYRLALLDPRLPPV